VSAALCLREGLHAKGAARGRRCARWQMVTHGGFRPGERIRFRLPQRAQQAFGLPEAAARSGSSPSRRSVRPARGRASRRSRQSADTLAKTLPTTIGLQPGNEDVALETLIKPELLFAAGQL
jgi:hypothetical protein